MRSDSIVEILSYLEPIFCLSALFLIQRRHLLREFKPLAFLLMTRVVSFVVLMPLSTLVRRHILSKALGYDLYFYGYWSGYAIETILGLFVIFGIYNLAMQPLPGLQRLGKLMFRWAAGIAIAVAVTIALGPHMNSNTLLVHCVQQLQQTQSVLTLCMLLFVCLAIRPMGLSFGSRIFGVSLGLGVTATADLVGAAWLSRFSTTFYSSYSIFNSCAICITLFIWIAYFALPEPKRRMIVLPTTSPFLRWNQISMALGDEPGFVTLGPVTPDMFAPAELEVMRRASAKMSLSIAN